MPWLPDCHQRLVCAAFPLHGAGRPAASVGSSRSRTFSNDRAALSVPTADHRPGQARAAGNHAETLRSSSCVSRALGPRCPHLGPSRPRRHQHIQGPCWHEFKCSLKCSWFEWNSGAHVTATWYQVGWPERFFFNSHTLSERVPHDQAGIRPSLSHPPGLQGGDSCGDRRG